MNIVHLNEVMTISRIIENPEELILSTARTMVEVEGLSQINMRKLASECNIALGTIYNYFPTKMDLIIAIIERFWNDCFASFYKVYDEQLDFFKQLEQLYSYLLDYLQQFQNNWLKDLSSLSDSNRSKGKAKEAEYMSRFLVIFERMVQTHSDEFNPVSYHTLDTQKLAEFIFTHFMAMLKRHDEDYAFFDLLLKRILL